MIPPEYNTSFSVILPKDRDDLFYLNMRVFHLVPPEKQRNGDGSPLLVWCAVYSQEAPVSMD
jgi:hypothetical protein